MKKLTLEEFISKARKIHGDKYDYSKVVYVNNRTRVCIICKEHGEFLQTPSDHLMGKGCKKCGIVSRGIKHRSNLEIFVGKATVIHGDKYDYSKVKYVDRLSPVTIICPEHGEFLQTPRDHLDGCGCLACNESHLERDIRILLDDNKIKYEPHKRNFDWLDRLELDFYLSDYNLAIECQGIQHFKEEHFFEPLEAVQNRDNKKKIVCENNGIRLLYYSDLDIEYPYDVITDKNKLLEKIEEYAKQKLG